MTCKYQLIRQDRENKKEYIIARFVAQGDALWAATLFESHRSISNKYLHFVKHGKKIYYGSTALPANTFNTI